MKLVKRANSKYDRGKKMKFDEKWKKGITKHFNKYKFNEAVFLEWASQEKIKRKVVCSVVSFERLLIKGGVVGDQYVSRKMPFSDHIAIYERIDGSRVMISQPYLNNCVNKEIIKESEELQNWLDERGLKLSLLNENLSWHVHGSTILMQIEVADKEKCKMVAKEKIKQFYEWIK